MPTSISARAFIALTKFQLHLPPDPRWSRKRALPPSGPSPTSPLRQLPCYTIEMGPESPHHLQLAHGGHPPAAPPGDGRGSAGRPSGDLLEGHLLGKGVGEPHEDAAVVEEGEDRCDYRHHLATVPACWVAELEKTATGFPISSPAIHSRLVWPQKFRIWVGMFPIFAGTPRIRPSISLRCRRGVGAEERSHDHSPQAIWICCDQGRCNMIFERIYVINYLSIGIQRLHRWKSCTLSA